MKKLYLLASVSVLLLLALPGAALAVDYGGVGGKPAHPQANNPRTQSIFIYQLQHGQQTTDGVQIFNSTKSRQTVFVYAVDSVLSSGGAFACAQASEAKRDVGAWIKLQSNTVTLAPNSDQIVPFTVTVPASADVGEHDGCIAIQAAGAGQSTDQSGVVLSFRSAIRVAVTIPGKITKQLAITGVKTSRLGNGNYQVTPELQNSGNVSLDTTIHASLVPVAGVMASASQGGVYPVLPHSTASWNFEVKRPFWGGIYRAQVTASYNANTASGLGQNANATQQTRQLDSAMLVVLPSSLAALVELAAVLVVILAVLYIVRRLHHSRHVRRHWKEYTVAESDTLTSLAKESHTSWKALAKANRLKPPYSLHAGQKLKLPQGD